MELPNIGEHCNETSCKLLDYLPLKCECGKSFCSEHIKTHLDVCSANRVAKDLVKIDNLYTCSLPNCKATSLVPLICEKCNAHFCVMHRHIVDCNRKDWISLASEREKIEAPVRQFKKAKSRVDQQLDIKLTDIKRKGKSAEMATKLQLMRVKNKAIGLKSIPLNDRVYFSVNYSDKILPLYVSKSWTVGRAIDDIASELKVPNNNNKNGALKLRLFKDVNGRILSNNMADKLETLLNHKIIVDGETLQLNYV